MAVLKILDSTGHTTVPFSEADKAEAKATFERLMGQGYMAFRMEKDGNRQIKSFKDVGEETILSPQLIGG